MELSVGRAKMEIVLNLFDTALVTIVEVKQSHSLMNSIGQLFAKAFYLLHSNRTYGINCTSIFAILTNVDVWALCELRLDDDNGLHLHAYHEIATMENSLPLKFIARVCGMLVSVILRASKQLLPCLRDGIRNSTTCASSTNKMTKSDMPHANTSWDTCLRAMVRATDDVLSMEPVKDIKREEVDSGREASRMEAFNDLYRTFEDSKGCINL
eukprot:TRINITY_DN2023_c0_g1_i1.p1 TRINITY_DN2023_c0_g1~~TRINITY_DN2023_c0_g1_i1.p1  ORF type:complete len:212 (-),score=32.79 TRINITY_DN2023_c0_g1_i1:8-643(-)